MSLLYYSGIAILDGNGDPLTGGKLNFYEVGTTTPKNTYSDEALSVPNPNPVVLDAAGRPQQDIYLSGQYKTVLTDATDATIRTTDPVGEGSTSGLQSGMILLWSGTIATIPSGWLLCDGANSTPDLRDSFIMGAGNTYATDDTGGVATPSTNSQGSHSHGAATGSTALTLSQIPSHNHGLNVPLGQWIAGSSEASWPGSYTWIGNALGITQNAGSGSGHTHTLGSDGGHTHTVSDLPPYYALAYIMKS